MRNSDRLHSWSDRLSPAPCRSPALSCNENDGESMDRDSQYSSSQKTKRMRTSFKHHQLRTMKSYFAINHNPDAKDLKQLAQKTGLTKRVLQVSTTSAPHLTWLQDFLSTWERKNHLQQRCRNQISWFPRVKYMKWRFPKTSSPVFHPNEILGRLLGNKLNNIRNGFSSSPDFYYVFKKVVNKLIGLQFKEIVWII